MPILKIYVFIFVYRLYTKKNKKIFKILLKKSEKNEKL